MNERVLLVRLAEEERDRAAMLRLDADRLERRAAELEMYAQSGGTVVSGRESPVKLLVSPAEAGRMLGVSRQMVVEMCRKGVLRHSRTDAGYYQIPRKAIRDYVDSLGEGA